MANEETTARLRALDIEIQEIRRQLDAHDARLNDNATIYTNLARLSADLVTLVRASNEQADRDRAAFQQETQRIWQYLLGQQRNGNGGKGNE